MKKTIKSLAGYLGCIVITMAVAYYIDGTAGIILTCALICALILSLVLTLIVGSSVKTDISSDKTLLMKNEKLTFKIKLTSRLYIPTPVIETEAECSAHLTADEGYIFKTSAAGGSASVISIPFTAKHSGAAELRIKRITLTDYLGIFSFNIKPPQENSIIKLAIYPDIPDVGVQTDFLKTASLFANSDDEEEETDETAIGSTGMPGYDHRKYEPGDPIKKINWKLSSKRDIYMVRLDEKVCSAGQMFFLDIPVTEENEFTLSVRDNVVEGALAMMNMLVREGKEASFFRYSDKLWLKTEIHSSADVYLLQEQLSDLAPMQPPQLIPPEIIAAGKTPICFTSAVSENDSTVHGIAAQSPDSLILTALSAGLADISPNIWTISDEFEFKKKGN